MTILSRERLPHMNHGAIAVVDYANIYSLCDSRRDPIRPTVVTCFISVMQSLPVYERMCALELVASSKCERISLPLFV